MSNTLIGIGAYDINLKSGEKIKKGFAVLCLKCSGAHGATSQLITSEGKPGLKCSCGNKHVETIGHFD